MTNPGYGPPMGAMGLSVIDGVQQRRLEAHRDERGELVELFRSGWIDDFHPVQWNYIRNEPLVLRGFHCHVRHTDLVTVLTGTMIVGIKDLRRTSSSCGRSEIITVAPADEVVGIPPGVGHGFYFPEPAIMVFAVSHEWNHDDELGCRWDDDDLGLDWGCPTPTLSERDRRAGTLASLQREVDERMTPGTR